VGRVGGEGGRGLNVGLFVGVGRCSFVLIESRRGAARQEQHTNQDEPTARTKHRPAHLADVDVVALVLKRRRHQRDAHARADARQLAAHAVGALEAALVEEVVVGPLGVLGVGLPGVVDVEEGEVVVGSGW